jgi:glycosyltransferase involved in cell wall biosynthesis
VIVPILFGSGTRIKILEAMAYGRTVVSTSIGAEGMGLRDQEHLLLAEDMAGFVRALERLAAEPEFSADLARRARAFQQEHFGPMAMVSAVNRLVIASQKISFGARESAP